MSKSEQDPQNPPGRKSIRRIVLPSGRSIEVVRFYDHEPENRGLHCCPECDSRLVQPTSWTDNQDGTWDLSLECPNCFHKEEGKYTQDEVDELEVQLDQGLADVLSDLRRLTMSNMEGEIGRFVFALKNDHILPEDF